jgi:hypothetical protein
MPKDNEKCDMLTGEQLGIFALHYGVRGIPELSA